MYIRDLIKNVAEFGVCCNIDGVCFNILAYADDIVLLSPSWGDLQSLITLLYELAIDTADLSCNLIKNCLYDFLA